MRISNNIQNYKYNNYQFNNKPVCFTGCILEKQAANAVIQKSKGVDFEAIKSFLKKISPFKKINNEPIYHPECLSLQMDLYKRLSSRYSKKNIPVTIFEPQNGIETITEADISAKTRMFERFNSTKGFIQNIKYVLHKTLFSRDNQKQREQSQKELSLINIVNSFNEDIVCNLLNFIPKISGSHDFSKYTISTDEIIKIAENLTPKNKKHITKFAENDFFPKTALIKVIQDINDENAHIYYKIAENFSINQIQKIIEKLNQNNAKFLMKLIHNSKYFSSKSNLIDIFMAYNEQNADVLNYIINHLSKNHNLQNQNHYIAGFGNNINKTNKSYAEKWIKMPKVNLSKLVPILEKTNKFNIDFADSLITANRVSGSDIAILINNMTTEDNSKFIKKLYDTTKININELKQISDLINDINDALVDEEYYDISELINNAENLQEKYAEIMDECGFNIESKIKELKFYVYTEEQNLIIPSNENKRLFFKHFLSNNNPKIDNTLKTADFDKYREFGIPLKYSRNDFYKKITEDILKDIKAEDKHKILHYFGLIDGEYTFDGLIQDKDVNKIKQVLKTTKGKDAVDKIKEEIIKFSVENKVKTKDKSLNIGRRIGL